MSDQQYYNLHPWNSFYQHYLDQHAIMMQYFQHLTQSTSTGTSCNACHTCHCGCSSPMDVSYRPPAQECYSATKPDSTSSGSSTTSSSSDYEIEEEEDYYEDDAESECEYELNVDAFIAMRAAKKELDKLSENKSLGSTSTSESDSIVLIDSDKEEFEFVDFGSYNTLSSKLARGIDGGINKKEEFETQKKIMSYLYGEKSSAIGGLETAMAVDFERLCDIHQPSLWPVLPVRL